LNQQFIETLIALRNQYQSLQEEIEREKAHAMQQLAHVNALLVEQLALENQQFVESLISLRHHYQALAASGERKALNGREQITHVNALLADQLVLQHNQPISMEASTISEQKALTQTVDIGTQEYPTQEDEADADFIPDDEASEADEVEEVDEASPTTAAAVVESPEAIPSSTVSVDGQAPKSPFPPLKTPMLAKYENLTKFQAVESLMRENAGTIMHIDYIIRALHGELDADALRAENSRMSQTLIEGKKKGLWHRVPGEPGCYTLDLDLIEPEVAARVNQPRQVSRRQKYPSRNRLGLRVLPDYSHLSLIDAIEQIVKENAGRILKADFVVRTLYGELSGQAFTKAREIVGRALWSGANQKRWQRLPRQKGAYTLKIKLVNPDLV
jgi:hypothetical protein